MDNLDILKKVSLGEATLKDKSIIESLSDNEFKLLLDKLKDNSKEDMDFELPEFVDTNKVGKKTLKINKNKTLKNDKAYSYVSKRITAIKTVNKLKTKSE
jgi:hypothetical protein